MQIARVLTIDLRDVVQVSSGVADCTVPRIGVTSILKGHDEAAKDGALILVQ